MPINPPIRPFLDWTVDIAHSEWRHVPVSLVGIPFSEHYIGDPRPNEQTNAPDAIRKDSIQFSDGRDHWDFDIGAPLGHYLPEGGRDGGNLLPIDGDFNRYFEECVAVMKRQFATSDLSLVIGGDHGVTIPALYALEVLGHPVHLVQVDAHIDWRDHVKEARLGYSSPIRRASELPWISGITQIGMRGTGSARREEFEAARDWGATIVPAQQVHENGIQEVIKNLEGKGPFYLTVDADGLDPSVMPGVLAPVPGGLRMEQIKPLVRALAAQGLVGMDMVEVAPAFDLANRVTTTTAGRLIVNTIAACLQNRKG